jgi:hypothetical protein
LTDHDVVELLVKLDFAARFAMGCNHNRATGAHRKPAGGETVFRARHQLI